MEYERLTERVGKGIAIKETSTNDNRSIWNAIERLAELEDKIEQGTLKEMNYPCNVGDKVFVVRSATSNNKNFYIFEDTVLQLCVDKNKDVNTSWLFITFYRNTSVFEWGFDKVFLTREEAKKRLKELQNG